MNFSIIIFNKFFNEGAILIKDFITHVRDVVQYCLIFNLKQNTRLKACILIFWFLQSKSKYIWFYHKVLLEWRPWVHDRHRGHSVQRFERNDLSGELGEATVNSALQNDSVGLDLNDSHYLYTPQCFWKVTLKSYLLRHLQNNDQFTINTIYFKRPKTHGKTKSREKWDIERKNKWHCGKWQKHEWH